MSTSAMLGTRFPTPPPPPEDDVDLLPARPKKPWEKEVRDEEGRRRFHGAFTGGFSAGCVSGVWQGSLLPLAIRCLRQGLLACGLLFASVCPMLEVP